MNDTWHGCLIKVVFICDVQQKMQQEAAAEAATSGRRCAGP